MQRKIFLLILFTCALFVLNACSGSNSQDAAKQALAVLNGDVTQMLAQARPLMMELAKIPEAHGTDAAACEKAMLAKYNNNPQYTAFGAATADGNLFCLTTPQTSPTSITDRAYFQRAMATKDFSVGDYQIGKVTKKQSAGIGYPVLDASGNVQGIVLAPIDLDWLNQRVANLKLPNGAHAMIVDSQGTILASNLDAKTWVGKPTSESVLGDAMMRQTEGAGEFAGPDGVMRVYAFTSPAGSNKNWHVAVGLPK